MISREPSSVSGQEFDVAIVGGGILGACHALESVHHGLKVLLLERDDFGGATSWSSHRIVHGGLRYIQTFDFGRHRESWQERRWFLTHFPDYVRPLQCLIPLYNVGLKRTSTLRAAFSINDVFSWQRNKGLPTKSRIPSGRILSPEETIHRFPHVERAKLHGGGLWHDAILNPPQRVLIEILRWATNAGACALNYNRVNEITRASSETFEIEVTDRVAGTNRTFRARHVINCSGSWTADLHQADGEQELPPPPLSLAFSVVLNRPPLSRCALAVSPGQSGDPTYFLVPQNGMILAGTVHLPWPACSGDGQPTEDDLSHLVSDLNDSIPHFKLTRSEIVRVFSGLLPAKEPDFSETLSQPVRHLHTSSTKDSRFISVWGVKYTTARSAAVDTLRQIGVRLARLVVPQPEPVRDLDWLRWPPDSSLKESFAKAVRRMQDEEAVFCLEDIVLRRTDWGLVPDAATAAMDELSAYLDLPRAAEALAPESVSGTDR